MDAFAREKLLRILTGFMLSKAVASAAELELADRLADAPKDAHELAKQTGWSAEHLDRLLRTLCSVGIFELVDGKFHMTPIAQLLVRRDKGSLWPVVRYLGDNVYDAFGELSHSVRTGDASWTKRFGKTPFEYFEDHPESGQIFDLAMDAISHRQNVSIVDAYDFSPFQRVVEVGGGSEGLLAAVVQQNPGTTGQRVARGVVLARTLKGLAIRSGDAAGDFVTDLPSDGDLYILRSILHYWEDKGAVEILRTCKKAMPTNARLLIVDVFRREGYYLRDAALRDLSTMVFGAHERTIEEFKALLSAADFSLTKALRTTSEVGILEACPKAA
jgi:hypothetical protein